MQTGRRWATYGLIFGSAGAILAAILAVPTFLGSADRAASAPSTSAPPARPVDHDPRSPPLYARDALVSSPQPPAGVALRAPDIGVTPTTVTIGIILVGLGAVSTFGIDTSALDPKVQRTFWEDGIARVNAAGGVDGRRLEALYATGDILSTDSMRAACRALTEDHHVFAVANVLGVSGDPILCVTRDHATPYLAVAGADQTYYGLSDGRLVTLEPTTTRTLGLLLDRLAILGLLKGHRVGVLHDTGAGGVDSGVLRRELARRGVQSMADGPLGGQDPLVVSGQVAAAQRRMQQDGVDTVLLLTNAVYGTVFATQADQERYTPTYIMSDLGYATAGDSFITNMPKSFFFHALAVTTTEIGRGLANLPESPLDSGCRHDFERALGRTVPRDSGDAVAALASCALLQLITMGLNGAGANPSRSGFSAALAGAGAFAIPGFGRGLLTAARLDAADEVSVASARGDCQCFEAIDGFRPAPGGP